MTREKRNVIVRKKKIIRDTVRFFAVDLAKRGGLKYVLFLFNIITRPSKKPIRLRRRFVGHYRRFPIARTRRRPRRRHFDILVFGNADKYNARDVQSSLLLSYFFYYCAAFHRRLDRPPKTKRLRPPNGKWFPFVRSLFAPTTDVCLLARFPGNSDDDDDNDDDYDDRDVRSFRKRGQILTIRRTRHRESQPIFPNWLIIIYHANWFNFRKTVLTGVEYICLKLTCLFFKGIFLKIASIKYVVHYKTQKI